MSTPLLRFEVGRRPSQQRCGNRRDGTSPHSIRSRVAVPCSRFGMRIAVEAVGIGKHRPFQSPKRSLAVADTDGMAGWNIAPFNRGESLRFPPFARRAFRLYGDRRRGRSVENARPLSFWSGSAGSRTERQAMSSEADPQATRKPTPPSTTLGRCAFRDFATPPARSPQDRKRRPFRIRVDDRATACRIPSSREHRPFHSRRKFLRKPPNTVDMARAGAGRRRCRSRCCISMVMPQVSRCCISMVMPRAVWGPQSVVHPVANW